MRADPPHIKVFVSSTSKGNPCEPGALDTGPYCETVMKTGQPLLVPDALENEAWKANPHVRLGMISYLGVPISWPDGRLFGTICVRDNKRNEYSEAYLKLLLHFRDMLQSDLKSLVRLHGQIEEREAKIRRSEAYLAEAQILSHTGSWAHDPVTEKIRYWSAGCYRIWGFDPAHGLPDSLVAHQRIHPDDRDRVWEEAMEARRQKRDYATEFRIVLPDGTVKYVEGIIHHVISEEGELIELVGTNADVTDRRRARDEHERLRKLESDLAHMNRLSVMGELTASLAHEITQPIASARNNARAAQNFLDRQPADLSEVREALSCVVGDADRAGNIIERVRDQMKKAPPRKGQFDLNGAINEVIVLGRNAVIKNGVSVHTRLSEAMYPIHGDRVQLQQVILNLFLNAVEAMGSVEAKPRDLLISTEQDRTDILVAVRDSGPGLDPSHLERVFDAFYTTKSSGMGMGLSICRSIINAHGGRLWAEPNKPRGAIFQFTLPAVP
jgi:PAS domain S-box-containing protein